MKKLLMTVATVAAITMFAGAVSNAAPAGQLSAGTNSDIVLVAGGCGRGWHRGPGGRCVRNLAPGNGCWWRRGPYGRWVLVCR